MTEGETAESLKDAGNACFKAEEYLKAAATYTKAIKLDQNSAVLYSNRSAAFLALKKVSKALADAETAISLRPTWEKGYYRKGCVLEVMEKWEEALAAFREAAEYNPKHPELPAKITNVTRYVRELKKKQAKQEGVETISSDEDYTSAMANLKQGGDIPYSKPRVEQWAKDMLFSAVNDFIAGELAATCYFLPGRKDEHSEGTTQSQAVKEGFKSPEVLAECCKFLEKYAMDTAAHATCLVVPKNKIAFPAVWEKKGWPFEKDEENGFFVQVESRDVHLLWFVPFSDKDKRSGRAVPKEPVRLDEDWFRLVPPLFPPPEQP